MVFGKNYFVLLETYALRECNTLTRACDAEKEDNHRLIKIFLEICDSLKLVAVRLRTETSDYGTCWKNTKSVENFTDGISFLRDIFVYSYCQLPTQF